MPANPDDQGVVYYISDATCTDPYQHSYIGITSNEKSRQYDHRRSGNFPDGFVWTILFRGTRKECGDVENKYRPASGTGWNAALGGGPLAQQEIPHERQRVISQGRVARMPLAHLIDADYAGRVDAATG